MVNHSGCRVLCVHADYLDLVDSVRHEMPAVEHFVALEGGGEGWLEYERLIADATPDYVQPEIARGRPAGDQLHQRHHRQAQGGDDHPPQRLGEHGRDDAAPAGHLRRPVSLDPADVPRQRLDLRLDRDGGRRHSRLRPEGGRRHRVPAAGRRADHHALRRADGADRHRQRPGGAPRPGPARRARPHGGRRARGAHHRAGRGGTRLGDHPGLRPHRDGAADQRLRAAAGARGAARRRSGPGSRRGRACRC